MPAYQYCFYNHIVKCLGEYLKRDRSLIFLVRGANCRLSYVLGVFKMEYQNILPREVLLMAEREEMTKSDNKKEGRKNEEISHCQFLCISH